MKIERKIFEEIKEKLAASPFESGGLLGKRDDKIVIFLFDNTKNDKRNFYVPNISKFNEELIRWASEGIEFAGIVHSHPNGCNLLSYSDIKYIKDLANCAKDIECLYFPIVTKIDENVILTAYLCKNGEIKEDSIEII